MHIVNKEFSTERYSISFLIEEEHNKFRLDRFLQDYFSSFSREFIKNKIIKGDIVIKDRPFPHKPSTKIYNGETVTVNTHKSDFPVELWYGKPLELNETPDIIFEDSDIVVFSKPSFMATHPTGKHLFNCASVYFEAKYGHGMHSVHRLDRETSGILIMTKNPKAAAAFTTQFENTEVKKCYLLISKEKKDFSNLFPFSATERLDSGENHRNSVVIQAYPEDSTMGKASRTDFQFLKQENDVLIALAFPQTGRQHQIRVHAATHGFSLLGDKLYNGDCTIFERFKDCIPRDEDHEIMEIPRHALHAIAIGVTYKNEKRIFQSTLPEDLLNWLKSKNVNCDDLDKLIQVKIKDYFEK